jgi:hypothetical protein
MGYDIQEALDCLKVVIFTCVDGFPLYIEQTHTFKTSLPMYLIKKQKQKTVIYLLA